MRVIMRILALTVSALALTVSPSLAADDIVSNPGPIHMNVSGTIGLGSLSVNLPQSTLDGQVEANGDITFPPEGIQFNTIEVPFNGVTISAKAIATETFKGQVEPLTGRFALLGSFKVQIRSGSLIPESCEVGPLVLNKLTSWLDGGTNFNPAGSGVLAKSGIYTPRIPDGLCGDVTDAANNGLQLGQENGRIQLFVDATPLQGTGSLGDIAATDDSVVVPKSGGSSGGKGSKNGGSGGSGGNGNGTGPSGSSDARIVGTKIYYDEGEAYVKVACDADEGERCKGTLRVKHGKKIIGRSSYRVEAGDVSDVDVPIKLARKTVRKGRAIKVTATLFTGMKPKKLLLDI